jgi:hypothetical protein
LLYHLSYAGFPSKRQILSLISRLTHINLRNRKAIAKI